MLPEINARRFEVLKSANCTAQWRGYGPKDYALAIEASGQVVKRMPERAFNRDTLRSFVDTSGDAESRFIAIMAWGRMRHHHTRRALAVKERWVQLIDNLVSSKVSRRCAYEMFVDRRKRENRERHLDGLGVAYFTKLLFFLRPKADAYIMDQWTGKSVNLLFAPDNIIGRFVKFDNSIVSDRNTPDDYEQFCQMIEALAKKLKVKAEDAEKRIFSNGGGASKDGKWRAFVKAEYQK
jgi:hypothetical protein